MTSNSAYVSMGDGGLKPGTTSQSVVTPLGIDPSLSQEDKDLRLALALQQQENAAAYDAHKKRHEVSAAARKNRTSRSNCSTGLASIRQVQKKNESNPPAYDGSGAYAAPGTESSDAALAAELQKVEQTTVGAAKLLEKIVQEDTQEKKSNNVRNGRSLNTM